jgi:pimeloyl-ACP methyl ester carboxylesterase
MERVFAAIGSPGLPRDAADMHAIAVASYDRDHDHDGSGRQLAAIIASGNRTAELARIAAPTLVIHGTADPLISPSGGRATKRAIPGAELMMVEGMGHDLPRAAWPRLIDGIAGLALSADGRANGHRPLPARSPLRAGR